MTIQVCKKRTVKRSDSLTSRTSVKSGVSAQNKPNKRPYRHVEMIPLNEISSIYDFSDGVENGLEGCIVILREVSFKTDVGFENYPLQLGKNRDDFMKLFLQYYWPSRPDADVNRDRPASELSTFNFEDSERLASSLSKSTLGKAKAKLTRTFSMSRRPSVASLTVSLAAAGPSTQSLMPSSQVPQNLPRPSSVPRNRFSNKFSQLVSPVFSPMSRKQSVSTLCLNNLSVSSLLKYPSMQTLPTQ